MLFKRVINKFAKRDVNVSNRIVRCSCCGKPILGSSGPAGISKEAEIEWEKWQASAICEDCLKLKNLEFRS